MGSTIPNVGESSPIGFSLPPKQRMGKDEFLNWALATNVKAEWVDGEVIVMAAANRDHMECRRWFDAVLTTYVRRKKLGRVGDDMFIDLGGARRLRVPDLFFVAQGREAIIGATTLAAPPDLALEVVSPGSEARDRELKFTEYESFGIREYWIVDPLAERVDAFALDSRNHYEPIAELDGALHSAVAAGFWLRTDWLWPASRPDEDEAVAQILAD
jgi:Uma2 family endonuclease